MDAAALRPLLDRIAGARVACVGDLMVDRYVYGEVGRISPEAPVPVFRRRSERVMLGAVGNVARNVAGLGGLASLYGELGQDAAGEEVLTLLKDEPRIEPHLVWDAHRPTTIKTRFVAGGQQLLRVDEEPDPDWADYGVPDGLALAAAQARCVLLSDYAKGVVGDALIEAAHALTARSRAPLVVDPKGRDFARYGPVDVLKPNAAELAAATDLPTGTDAEVEAALKEALSDCAARAIVVTRAAQGMSILERGGTVVHVRGRRREVFDVSGAGDTSLAALGLALAVGEPLEQAVAFAIAAAGVAVEKAGTAVVTPEDLLEAPGEGPTAAASKMVSRARAAETVARWRAQGLKVGFTNGCFDVLHRGHVAYLAQARSWCDRLVVGVNDDASVRRLKGEGRPVNDIGARAAVLASLAAVDLVCAFAEDTPLALIEALRPDVLVKGADYAPEQVVGGDLVRGYGGELRLAALIDGYSTTRAIERMREQS